MGASFGGVTSMLAGSRLGSKIAGVVSVSGETELGNQYGGPQSELDAVAAVPKLRGLIPDHRRPPRPVSPSGRGARAATQGRIGTLAPGDGHPRLSRGAEI